MESMNKKRTVIILTAIISFFLLFVLFIDSGTTKNNATPGTLYGKNNNIDLLVYQNASFVCAKNVNWIKEITTTPGELLGEILRTNVDKNFRDFDATKLSVGTKIYSVKEREDIIVAYINGKYIPYFKYLEG